MSSSPGRDVVVACRRVLDVLALRYWGSEVPVTELTPLIVLFFGPLGAGCLCSASRTSMFEDAKAVDQHK